MARHSSSLRPTLHRMRGIKIGSGVFIGDEAYLENEYPECIEIGDDVQISVRALFLAHTRGPGRIVVGERAYIGPNVIVACSGDRTLRIGADSVVSAGCVITRDVPPGVLIGVEPAQPVARVTVPLSRAATFQEFVRGLAPLRRRPTKQPEPRGILQNRPDTGVPRESSTQESRR